MYRDARYRILALNALTGDEELAAFAMPLDEDGKQPELGNWTLGEDGDAKG